VKSVSWNGDGTKLASASDDKTVRVWDAHTGSQLAQLQGHTHIVTSVSWNVDGTKLASASYDKTVRVWDSVLDN
jgi:WD40 repeat protein